MLEKQTKFQTIESPTAIQDFYSKIARYFFDNTITSLQNSQIANDLFRNAILAVASFHLDTTNQKEILKFFKTPSQSKTTSKPKIVSTPKVDLIINTALDYIGIYIFTQLEDFTQEIISNHNQLNLLREEIQLANSIIENLVNFNLARDFIESIFEMLKENIIEPFQESTQLLITQARGSIIESDIHNIISQIRSSNWDDRYFTHKAHYQYLDHFILANHHTLHSYMISSDPAHQILGTHKAIPLIEDLTTEIQVLNEYKNYFQSNYSRALIMGNNKGIYIHRDKLFNTSEFLNFLLFHNPQLQSLHEEISSHPDQEILEPFIQRSSFLDSLNTVQSFLDLSIQFEDEIITVTNTPKAKKKSNYINPKRERSKIEKHSILNNLSGINPVIIDQETSKVIKQKHERIQIPQLTNFCMTFAKLALNKHDLEISSRLQNLLLINLTTYLVNLTFEYFTEQKIFIQHFPIHNQDHFLDENEKRRLMYLIPSRKKFQKLGPSLAYSKLQPETGSLNVNLPTSNLGLIIGFSNVSSIESVMQELIESEGIISTYNKLHSISNTQVIEDEYAIIDNIFNDLLNLENLHDLENYAKILSKLSHFHYNSYISCNRKKTLDVLNHLINVFENTDYSIYKSSKKSTHSSHRFLFFLNNKLKLFRTIGETKQKKNQKRIQEIAETKSLPRTKTFILAEESRRTYSLDINEIKENYSKRIDLAIFKSIIKKSDINIQEIQILLTIINKYDLFEEILQDLILKKNNVEFLQSLINSDDIEAKHLGYEFLDRILLNLLEPGSEMPFYIHYTYAVLKTGNQDLLFDKFYTEVALKIARSQQAVKVKLQDLYHRYNTKKITSDRRDDNIFYKDYLSILKKDGII